MRNLASFRDAKEVNVYLESLMKAMTVVNGQCPALARELWNQ